jgi:putative transposase
MARLARVVVPGVAHHVTQRGNRRQQVFFGDEDYASYRSLVAEHCLARGVEVRAWCLMPNHVHLMLVPPAEGALRAALGEAQRRYSRGVNFREGWRGFLWQGRFASCPMDDAHMMACARYIELNPVRAHLAPTPEAWKWSSARAHLGGEADGLTAVAALGDQVDDWRQFLDAGLDADTLAAIRAGERTGRPLGSAAFIGTLEARTGRRLARQKPGRKPAKKGD